jgi:hypothetical protein
MGNEVEEQLDDEAMAASADEETEAPVEVARTDLSKRRTIDNLMEERRLRKSLADLDFDL